MAYNLAYPLDTEYVANIPTAIRTTLEQLRADTDEPIAGAIVNAKKLQGYLPTNSTGGIPISNGTVNTNLNADMIDGKHYSDLTPIAHVGAKGTSVHAVADGTNAGFMPSTHYTKVADIIANPNNYYNAYGFGSIAVTGSNTASSVAFSDTLTITPSSLLSITSTGKIITFDLAKDGSNNALHNHVIASGSNSGFINSTMYNNYQTAYSHVSDTTKHYNFGNITVGATTIVADTTQDNLTFTAGTGITLSADAGTDTVTIAVTQDGHNHAVATTGSNGFMSSTMVSNLTTAITHYGLNHNNFGNILVGSTTVASDAMNDTVEFVAGTGITITPDATNDKVTFAVSNVNATQLSGYSAGNASGNIPLNNGTLNVNLNADKLDSLTSTQFLRSDANNTGVKGSSYYDLTAGEVQIGSNGGNFLFFNQLQSGLYDGANSRYILKFTTSDNTVFSQPAWTFTVAPTAPTYISNVATGTAPFTVASSTKVTNLNADKVDGNDSTSLVLVDGSQAMSGALNNSSYFLSNTATNAGAKFVMRNAGSNYIHAYASANDTFAVGLSATASALPASPVLTVDANGIASAGSVKVASKFEIKYNAISDSLDFNYVA